MKEAIVITDILYLILTFLSIFYIKKNKCRKGCLEIAKLTRGNEHCSRANGATGSLCRRPFQSEGKAGGQSRSAAQALARQRSLPSTTPRAFAVRALLSAPFKVKAKAESASGTGCAAYRVDKFP
jgi:hypothetical protein